MASHWMHTHSFCSYQLQVERIFVVLAIWITEEGWRLYNEQSQDHTIAELVLQCNSVLVFCRAGFLEFCSKVIIKSLG